MDAKKIVLTIALEAGLVLLCLTGGGMPVLADTSGPTIGTFDFRKTPLGDVLKVFTEMTKKNVVATPEILDTEITLFLQEVTAMAALETLCKNYNLWYTVEGNIIRVMKVEEYGRELVLRRDEKTRIIHLQYASCLAVAEMIADVFGDRILYNEPKTTESYGHIGTDKFPQIGEEMAEIEDSDTDTEATRRRRTDEKVFDAGGVELDETDIKKILAKSGQVRIEELLQLQVGHAQAMLTVFPRNNAVVVRSIDMRLLNDVEALINRVDSPTRQVLLEVKILEINLGDGFDSFFNMSVTPGGELDADGNVSRDIRGVTGIDLLNAAPLAGNTLKFASIASEIQTKMELLKKEDRLNTIATPLMLCANNAAARFFQGVTSPVRKGYTVTQARYGENDQLLTPGMVSTDYEEAEVGVTLQISPSINMDRTITLKIDARIESINQGEGPPFAYTIGGAAQEGKTDTISQTTIEDIIVAMDGQSVALGGLIKEEDVSTEEKVPLLGDIPLLGFFFKSISTGQKRSEVVFLIEPHIIMSPAEAGDVNRRLLESISEHSFYKKSSDRIFRFDESKSRLEPAVPEHEPAAPGRTDTTGEESCPD